MTVLYEVFPSKAQPWYLTRKQAGAPAEVWADDAWHESQRAEDLYNGNSDDSGEPITAREVPRFQRKAKGGAKWFI